VHPSAVVLCHSPLTTLAAWGDLPAELESRGHKTLVVDIHHDEHPPYAMRYVAAAATQIAEADLADPVVLVGHSGAGPLLPQIGYARRSAHHAVGGYVFFDASLPRPGSPTRLELLHTEDHSFAHELTALLDAGGRFPDWDDEALLALARPRGKDFFTERLPHPPDWPDAPVAYVRTSMPYVWHARVARGRSWPVVERELGHFPGITYPTAAADAVEEALHGLPGLPAT